VLFFLSTNDVDNFVDKPLLTPCKPSIRAGFNKLPKTKAKINPFKINVLRSVYFPNEEARKKFSASSGLKFL